MKETGGHMELVEGRKQKEGSESCVCRGVLFLHLMTK